MAYWYTRYDRNGTGKDKGYISREISDAMCKVMEKLYNKKDFVELLGKYQQIEVKNEKRR